MTTGRRVVSARSLVADAELPTHEASRLLQAATGRDRASLARDDAVTSAHAQTFEELVARRARGEPLQYIEGTSQFGPIEVVIDPRVLIPRPETEELWEFVVSRLAADPPAVVVDLGTGSGNLALAIKHSFRHAEVHAVELSVGAFEVARMNVAKTGLDVHVHNGDLFAPLPAALRGQVDLIVSNPPYVSSDERGSLPAEIRDHEPAMALFAGSDGLDVLRRVIDSSETWLAPGGLLACEIGSDQGAAATKLVSWADPEIVTDLSGRDRFLFATKGGL